MNRNGEGGEWLDERVAAISAEIAAAIAQAQAQAQEQIIEEEEESSSEEEIEGDEGEGEEGSSFPVDSSERSQLYNPASIKGSVYSSATRRVCGITGLG